MLVFRKVSVLNFCRLLSLNISKTNFMFTTSPKKIKTIITKIKK